MNLFREKQHMQIDNSPTQLELMQRQMQLNNIQSELVTYKKMANRNLTLFNMLSKNVKSLCILILGNKYMQSQLGGDTNISDMDINSLVQFTYNEYIQTQAEYLNNIGLLSNAVHQKEQVIEGLMAQLSANNNNHHCTTKSTEENEVSVNDDNDRDINTVEESSKNESIISKSNDQEYDLESKTDINIDSTFVQRIQGVKIETPKVSKHMQTIQDLKDKLNNSNISSNDVKPINVEKNNNVNKHKEKEIYHAIDLNAIIEGMDDVSKDLIRLIGIEGISRAPIIRNYLIGKKINTAVIANAFNLLEKSLIIEKEKIDIGVKWFHVYELTNLGARILYELENTKPVETEKSILIKENASAVHGYMILEATEILEASKEYMSISCSRKTNTIKLENNKSVIPDIIAKNSITNETEYYEVERGTHLQKDFNDKCNKLRLITSNIRFIVPDKKVATVVGKKVTIWLNGKDEQYKKGLKIYIIPMKQLEKQSAEIIVDCDAIREDEVKNVDS